MSNAVTRCCDQEVISQCINCLAERCKEHLSSPTVESADRIFCQMCKTSIFPLECCPSCYGDTATGAILASRRLNYLVKNNSKLNEKERAEYNEWVRPLREWEEEETENMSGKKCERWRAEFECEEMLLETKDIDITEFDLLEDHPLFKVASWGESCIKCVYMHYLKLWNENSHLGMNGKPLDD